MDVFLLSAVRTPIGKFLGGLAEHTAPKLGSLVVAEALKRASVPADKVDEVIMGCVIQAGLGQNPARQAALGGGLPDTINAHTTNMVCGSGLKAVMLAAQGIISGDANIIVAGGMESMSRAPFLLPNVRGGYKYGDQTTQDALIKDGLWCAFENWPMGNAAEHIAVKFGISRAEQDRFSVQSHQRAAAAWESGAFANEVLTVAGGGRTPLIVSKDEGIRADSSTESLSKLKPAFNKDGTVTAGNASQLSDGAAAVVVANAKTVEELKATPLARIVATATSGVAPKDIFIAPVTAIQQVLAKAKLSLSQIDLFELNEAFATQVLAGGKELKLDESKVNVNGGAIAMGHPIGCSGTRVLVTLAHALHAQNKRYGVASLCLGGGNAVAMVIERV
ncbi:acetyl-CoA C-acetyltransferase [soil metagenome]